MERLHGGQPAQRVRGILEEVEMAKAEIVEVENPQVEGNGGPLDCWALVELYGH